MRATRHHQLVSGMVADRIGRPLLRNLALRATTPLALGIALWASAPPARAQETGEVVVKTKPPGAEVKIDGETVGKAPATKAGLSTSDRHTVEAIWPDGTKQQKRVKVTSGKP